MRYLMLLVLTSSCFAVDLEFLGVDYKQQDKQQHAILGAAVAGTSILVLEKFVPDAKWYTKAAVGIIASAVVGAAKEWSDSKDLDHHCVEKDDFVATATGGALVSLTLCWDF